MSEQTLRSLQEHPLVPPTDRRAWVRVRSEQDTVCLQEGGHAAWSGTVRDISSRGLALALGQRMEPGACLTVELETTVGGPRRFRVRVVHSTQEGKDRWVIGCTLAKPLSEQELQALIVHQVLSL